MDNSKASAPAFTHLIDLAAERFGGQVLWCTDDFFAEKENLIKPSKPIFIADKYTDRGKWMDGWESRRKRTEGHDIAVIQLGAAGVIKGFDVDTAHFLGNQPQACSIEACYAPDGLKNENGEGNDWVEVLPRTTLNPGSQHFVELSCRLSFVRRTGQRTWNSVVGCQFVRRTIQRAGECATATNNRIPTTSSLTLGSTSTPMAAWPGSASTARCNATGRT
jgi:hypothetical protein